MSEKWDRMRHFLDVGANSGQTFDWYLLKTDWYDGWHIWCFEPSVRHLQTLRSRCLEIMDNNSHNFTITVCPFALSDFTGYTKLFETHDHLGDSLINTGYPNRVETFCGVVDAAKFIQSEIPVSDKMVLKVDTEGSEIRILDSILNCASVLSRVEAVYIEFHAITMSKSQQIIEKLKAANIRVESWTL